MIWSFREAECVYSFAQTGQTIFLFFLMWCMRLRSLSPCTFFICLLTLNLLLKVTEQTLHTNEFTATPGSYCASLTTTTSYINYYSFWQSSFWSSLWSDDRESSFITESMSDVPKLSWVCETRLYGVPWREI